ncbi:unnamed protein product, partial [Symbiodinium pilosum]
EYHHGTKYATPVRLAWHARKMEVPEDDLKAAEAHGAKMAEVFDRMYVSAVTPTSPMLFEGLRGLLRTLEERRTPMGILSNAASSYLE